MGVDHYENFPVASVLLPARLRHPVATVYWFARHADDFADEEDRTPAERLALLEDYRGRLESLERGEDPGSDFFRQLGRVISDYGLPYPLFHDLLDAFCQDVVKKRYTDFDDVLDYCRRSANPVGRLVLHLYGAAEDSRHLSWSDSICSALQLINFLQDIQIDFAKDRVYLPQEDLARFGVSESQIEQGDAGGAWTALMEFEIVRARSMMLSGAPLAKQLRGRIGMELRMIVQGGLRVLEKLELVHGDIFRHRPTLRSWDWPLMLGRALAM